ncbi:Sm domain-containing protein [Entamoeba marina]
MNATLISVDQLLNIKVSNITTDTTLYPQFQTMTTCFIRGNVIRYISMAQSLIDTRLLHDATLLELNDVKCKQ